MTATAYAPYADNMEHLGDELRRLDLYLQRQVLRLRARQNQETPAEFRGLFISDAEVDAWLAAKAGKWRTRGEGTRIDDFRSSIAALTAQIDARIAASQAQAVPLRLPHLAGLFELDPIEVRTLLIALAPAIDLHYYKLYAYLQDDVTRKKPTVDLGLSLLCETMPERLAALALFARDGALRRQRLITLAADPADPDVPLLAQSITLDERIVDFLLGRDRLDARWEPFAHWAALDRTFDDLVFPDDLRAMLRELCAAYQSARAAGSDAWVLYFHGPAGSGRRSAAQACCRAAGLGLLVVDLPTLLQCDARPAETFALLLREAWLYGAALYLDGWQAVADDVALRLGAPLYELAGCPGLVFLSGATPWRPPAALAERAFVPLAFPAPGPAERLRLWQAYAGPIDSSVSLAALATTFRFTGGQIVEALRAAQHRALGRGAAGQGPSSADLYHGCRAVSARRLGALARWIAPKHAWQDLVLPGDALAQLAELCAQVRHRLTVYDQWGFDRKLSLGKGLVALFSGPSGTGKTFAAEIIAGELGMDLYQIDLSCVVSKYIGETEKNLSRLFQEAQDSNAILFFDEADALFGKRTEVRDAHDRYANIEINYLLQRVEEYEGVIILASNVSKHIDAAFLRRMHFVVEFPFPDEDYRLRIWQGIFPVQAPLGSDVDLGFLASQFKIAGGNIKNVALSAAFRAAMDGGVIQMEHLVLAIKREYQKLGKVCEKAEFEQYYTLVR